jgi:RNA polymerase sigma-70 factor (ECF subfamily)
MAPALAQRFRTDRAFERLYRRHVADVYRYSLAVLRNPADAEDVTQTTFLNAYRAFKRGERPDAANNWLIKIAHNVCRQRFRTSARRPQEVALDGDVTGPIAEEQEGPSAQDIRRGLGQLAFNQRAALVARELEGRSYAEIGEILGLSVAAVETLIFRARRALREQLEGSLTCHEAELAISRQLDGRLPRGDKGVLRAHLRECGECATFARRLRAQRSALKALAAVPIPGSLASFFGGTSVGSGVVALKAGAIAATFVAAGAATSVGVKYAPWQDGHRHAAAASAAAPAPSALAQAPSSGAGRARSSSAIDKSSRTPIARIVVRTKPTRPARVTRATPQQSSAAPTHSGSNGDQAQSESHGRSTNDQGGHDNSSPAQRKLDDSHDGHPRGGKSTKQDQGGGGSGGGGGDSSGTHSGGGDKHGGGDGQRLPDLSLPQAPVDVSDALPKKGKG